MLKDLERRRRGLEDRCRGLVKDAAEDSCFEDEIKRKWRIEFARDRLQVYSWMESAAAAQPDILENSLAAVAWLDSERRRLVRGARRREFTTTEIVQIFEIDEAKKELQAAGADAAAVNTE